MGFVCVGGRSARYDTRRRRRRSLDKKTCGKVRLSLLHSLRGPYIKDVHTEGGRGLADIVREVAWI